MAKTPEYKAWAEMWHRCTNKNSNRYKHYGERGISVCKEWENFSAFFAALGHRPSSDYSLHRIDNNLGYSPGNCKWATIEEQMNETSRNKYYFLNGEKYTVSQLSRKFSVSYGCIRRRIKSGKTIENAILPAKKNSLRKKALNAGIPYMTVYYRIRRGWTEKKALTPPHIDK